MHLKSSSLDQINSLKNDEVNGRLDDFSKICHALVLATAVSCPGEVHELRT